VGQVEEERRQSREEVMYKTFHAGRSRVNSMSPRRK
jgi:hypothetical protein